MTNPIDRLFPAEIRHGDVDIVRRARLTVTFALALGAMGIPNAAQMYAHGAMRLTLLIMVSTTLTLMSPVVLWRTRSTKVAAHWLLGAFCASLVSGAFISGGIESPGLFFHPVVPLLAVLLLGPRSGVAWTCVTLADFGLLLGVTRLGWVSDNSAQIPRAESLVMVGGTACLSVFLLARLYEKRKDEMASELDGARRNAEAAHASARVVLDNVAQALVIAGPDGRLDAERSRAVDLWFGASAETVFDLFAPIAPRFTEWLRIGYDDLFEDTLPRELVLEQLPSNFLHDGRHFQVVYRPIEEAEKVVRVLLVITDVTEAAQAERAEEEQRELLSLVRALLQDRTAFLEFFREMRARVSSLSVPCADRVTEQRELHTLKGNAGFFGLASTARLCHGLEDKLALDNAALDDADRAALRTHWAEVERRIEPLLGPDELAIQLSLKEYDDALSAALGCEPHPAMAERIRGWANEPTRRRLAIHARQVHALAAQLGKGEVTVRIDDGGLRLPRARFGALWTNLVHVVRNAVDHGLETPEERRLARKATAGEVVLCTRIERGEVVIEVADDGRGIDWSRVEVCARRRGLRAEDAKDLVAAIFADGLSTRDEVSEVSGRGVGMAAVRDSVVALGGRVEIVSARGQGTRFVFRAPIETPALRMAS